MKKGDKIFITNHEKMPGKAFARVLKEKGFDNLLVTNEPELDLSDRKRLFLFFQKRKPDYVILTSVKSGGIQANIDRPAEFLSDNLRVQDNVIDASRRYNVKRLFFISASCIYPRDCLQPIREEYLLRGPLEPTNEAYAIANIAGIKMCQAYNRQYKTNFISLIPSNPYGPGDSFDPKISHVIPALIRKLSKAKLEKKEYVTLWGSGSPKRDFLYIDDLVSACLFLMQKTELPEVINISTGSGVSIRKLAASIKTIIGFTGEIKFDAKKPDGMPEKILDVGKINSLGWKAETDLSKGLKKTFLWYKKFLGNKETEKCA